MSLTNEDLKKIENLFKAGNELIFIRLDKLEARIFNLEMGMKKNHQEHMEILEQIKELRESLSEDINTICEDVDKLDRRVTKLESKVT